MSEIIVKIIHQLSDNYSYIIYSKNNNHALVIDPSESKPIINFLKNKEGIDIYDNGLTFNPFFKRN